MEVAGVTRRLPPAYQRQILFIFREIIANIERHASAKEVRINLSWEKEWLALKVQDDGRGFDPQVWKLPGHLGMNIINERATEIGGEFKVRSELELGTEVLLIVPHPPKSEPAIPFITTKIREYEDGTQSYQAAKNSRR
jgi:nitrate/nitrite-specific signal transduction histidine kinase